MSKVKVLGTKYGIEITRPWSKEMYAHNEKIAAQMKGAITIAIANAYDSDNQGQMEIIGKAINAYGYGSGMSFEDIYEDCLHGLDNVHNHWLQSDTWPDLLKAGLVKPIKEGFIGYDK